MAEDRVDRSDPAEHEQNAQIPRLSLSKGRGRSENLVAARVWQTEPTACCSIPRDTSGKAWAARRRPSEAKALSLPATTTLFVDVGGVLLTDGWGRGSRSLAAQEFELDLLELDDRHSQAMGTYEMGRLNLAEYLDRVVFHVPRSFSREAFWNFMCEQSKPFPEMIDLIGRLKAEFALKIVVVSNEARELNAYRVERFGLGAFVDCFVSSCFVHIRKPDVDIFRLALDVSQATADQVIYIENTSMFVQIADGIGIPSILHTDYPTTRAALERFGFRAEP
jgi:putative hydrolase of the HAD superfamily